MFNCIFTNYISGTGYFYKPTSYATSNIPNANTPTHSKPWACLSARTIHESSRPPFLGVGTSYAALLHRPRPKRLFSFCVFASNRPKNWLPSGSLAEAVFTKWRLITQMDCSGWRPPGLVQGCHPTIGCHVRGARAPTHQSNAPTGHETALRCCCSKNWIIKKVVVRLFPPSFSSNFVCAFQERNVQRSLKKRAFYKQTNNSFFLEIPFLDFLLQFAGLSSVKTNVYCLGNILKGNVSREKSR